MQLQRRDFVEQFVVDDIAELKFVVVKLQLVVVQLQRRDFVEQFVVDDIAELKIVVVQLQRRDIVELQIVVVVQLQRHAFVELKFAGAEVLCSVLRTLFCLLGWFLRR